MAPKRTASSASGGSPSQKKAKALLTSAPPPSASGSKEAWKSTTHSHGAGRTGSFTAHVDANVAPHTLIVGTQPSDISLGKSMYFGNDANAFWACVGEALGFRRGFQSNPREDNACVPSIEEALTPSFDRVTEYSEAVLRLTSSGYALWDILESSVRAGSLDSAIKKGSERPADIRRFVKEYPTVRRIVFATGKGSAAKFKKHFLAWLQEGGFVSHKSGIEVFGAQGKQPLAPLANVEAKEKIELIVPPSVSPACAAIPVAEKIRMWKEIVFNVPAGQ